MEEDLMRIIPAEFKMDIISSTFNNSESFNVELRSEVRNEEQFKRWLHSFEEATNTTWILRSSGSCTLPMSKFVFSRDYVCQHNRFHKVDGSKKCKDCNASLTVRIKKINKYTRCRDPYVRSGLVALIKINFNHSHRTGVAEAWNWLRRSEETKQTFLQYFTDGMSPSAARIYHSSVLMTDGPEQLANSRINPPKHWVYQIHDKWLKENFGSLKNGPDLARIAHIKQQKFQEEGCLVSIKEDNCQFCIILVTPLMVRALQFLSQSRSFFIDTSASCDQANNSLTVVLIPSKAGAIPVGVCIHGSQSQESYETVLKELKLLWDRVKTPSIENFMTDDSCALKNALKVIWPNVKQLLCQFHVAQAMWRWLCDAKHGVDKSDRQGLMKKFQKLMYSSTLTEMEENKKSLFESPNAKKINLKFQNHIEILLERQQEWMKVHRLQVHNHGHNTNNYAEATIRILKDIVLCRIKAFNSVALMDFVFHVLEKYYVARLLDMAFGRVRKPHLLFEKFVDKGLKTLEIYFIEQKDDIFLLTSKEQPEKNYEVSIHYGDGRCTCFSGLQGAFCKHQAAIHLKYGIPFSNSPELMSSDKTVIFKIALGDSTIADNFLDSMESTTSFESIQLHERNFESTTSHSQDEFPHDDDAQKLENRTSIVEGFKANFEKFHMLITNNVTDDGLMNATSKFIHICKTINTANQLNAFLRQASQQTSTYPRGRKIKVQPTSIARRRPNVTHSSSRLPAGRPRKECTRVPKRPRSLSCNVALNRPNAKSHGDGHSFMK